MIPYQYFSHGAIPILNSMFFIHFAKSIDQCHTKAQFLMSQNNVKVSLQFTKKKKFHRNLSHTKNSYNVYH